MQIEQSQLAQPPDVAGDAPSASSTDATGSGDTTTDQTQTNPSTPDAGNSDTGADNATGGADTPKRDDATPQAARGAANAALLTPDAQRAEAKRGCATKPPPTNHLLGIGGTFGNQKSGSWAVLALAIAAAAALAGGAAYARRRNRTVGSGQKQPRSPIESIAAIVAICAGVTGIAVQFVPGIAAHERPSPEASMQVRDVDPRITLGDYAHALGIAPPRANIDAREIGNVVWVELRLKGYAGQKLKLQWGSYEDDGEALIPGSNKSLAMKVSKDSTEQTVFQPVWVGYPRDARFEVHFRLLDDRGVRDLASTGSMKGARYRYACGPPV